MHRDLVANPVLSPPTGPGAGLKQGKEAEKSLPYSHARSAFGESGPGATCEYCGIWRGSDLARGAHLSGEEMVSVAMWVGDRTG